MKLAAQFLYFKFSKSQRSGLIALFVIILVFQMLYFFVDFNSASRIVNQKQKKWITLAIPAATSATFSKKASYTIRPFNPNFITDFKGYKLGMSVSEIDRLLAFRKTNRYVNSAEEFQAVTKVSDSLLQKIKPYFKFPDWVTNRKQSKWNSKETFVKTEPKIQIDINTANQEELKKVYGIGDGLSERILHEREKFGGFVSMEQLQSIWGLSPTVIEAINKNFKIDKQPTIQKIKINQATIKELMHFPYFRYPVAKAIVTHRSMNGDIKNIDDLTKISNFPLDKIKIIALYLEF